MYDILITTSVNKNSISIGDKIIITITMENISSTIYTFLQNIFERNASLLYYDSEGDQLPVKSNVLVDYDFTPRVEDFFKLKKEEKRSFVEELILKKGSLELIDGDYTGRYLEFTRTGRKKEYVLLFDAKSIKIKSKYYLLESELDFAEKLDFEGKVLKKEISSDFVSFKIE